MLNQEESANLEQLTKKQLDRRGMFRFMERCLAELKGDRPNDRSEIDRRYAITITDFEKVMAYFKTYIIDEYMLSGVSQSPNE